MMQKITIAAALMGLAMSMTPASAAAQVKVGAVLSASGPASFLGDPERKTLDMYVEDINRQGGVYGLLLQLVV